MGTEIERKFLVAGDGWRAAVDRATPIRQGYLARPPAVEVRVRRAGDRGFLTIKEGVGLTRREHEWPIPADEADELLERCLPITITKTRHLVGHSGLVWEVDVFEGPHTGLVVAEVELDRADQAIDQPDWLGAEVTGDERYSNARLSLRPDPTAPASVYIASPLGFTAAGRRYAAEVLLPAVRAAGFEPLDPWVDPDRVLERAGSIPDPEARRLALIEANASVGRANERLIDAADAVLAVLDGSDVDSGTAAEIGYAAAIGRPVVGVRGDLRRAGDNDASVVNLQVAWFIERSGGAVVADLDHAMARLTRLVGAVDPPP